jgi:hypothetical protein
MQSECGCIKTRKSKAASVGGLTQQQRMPANLEKKKD